MFFRGDLWRSQKDGEMESEGGFSQNWPQHFQVLGIIVKHHENSGVWDISQEITVFGIKRSTNNSSKGSLKLPKGELYFPSKTTRAKVCRLGWGIAWVSTFPVWAFTSVFVMYYLYVYLLIYTYLHAYTNMRIRFIVMCGIALCFIALYYVHVLYFHPCPNIWFFGGREMPVKLGGHRTLCWCPGEICLEGAPIWDGWIQCWNERCFIFVG